LRARLNGVLDSFRHTLLTLLINAAAVALAAVYIPGIAYSGGVKTLLFIAFILGVMNVIVKPILSVLSMPGSIAFTIPAKIIVNTIMLYLASVFVRGFTILPFPFPGYFHGSFVLEPIMLPVAGTALLAALTISFISGALMWLTDA
jgi:putative membrane protein